MHAFQEVQPLAPCSFSSVKLFTIIRRTTHISRPNPPPEDMSTACHTNTSTNISPVMGQFTYHQMHMLKS